MKGLKYAKHNSEGLWLLGLVVGLGLFLACGVGNLEKINYLAEGSSAKVHLHHDYESQTGFARDLRVRILPHAFDALQYIQHAQEAVQKRVLRLRDTEVDNAPHGREMHWSQALIWLLIGLGWIHAFIFNCPHAAGIEAAASYALPVLFVPLMVVIGILVRKKFGEKATGILLFGLFACLPISEAMTFGQFDHHGPACIAVVLMVLALVLAWGRGRAETLSTTEANFWATCAGLAGSVGMWLSASTTIPCIFALGLSLLLSSLMAQKDRSPLIRRWGISGAVASLFFYLLEYFPFRMGIRLEINHPFYALSWVSGAELFARLGSVRLKWKSRNKAAEVILLFVLVFLASFPVLAIVIWGNSIFVPMDKFVRDVHKLHIMEFESIPNLFLKKDASQMLPVLFTPLLGILSLGIASIVRKSATTFLLSGLPLLTMSALGIWQIRWLIPSNGLGVLALAVSFWALVPSSSEGDKEPSFRLLGKKNIFAAALPTITVGGMFFFCLIQVVQEAQKRARPEVLLDVFDSYALSGRDIGHLISERMPPRQRPVILSSPTMTLLCAYFSGGKSIGTFYWENAEGLKATDTLFLAPDEEKFREAIIARGVTHIVLPLGELDELLSDGLGGRARFGMGPLPGWFLQKALATKNLPDWLSPVYYERPQGVEINWAALLEVRIGQTKAEALIARGDHDLSSGDRVKARERYMLATKIEPSLSKAWLRLAELAENNTDREAILQNAIGVCDVSELIKSTICLLRERSDYSSDFLETLLPRLLALNPTDPDLNAERAIQLLVKDGGDDPQVASRLSQAKELISALPIMSGWSGVRQLVAEGLLEIRAGQKDAAQKVLQRAFSKAREEDLPMAARGEIVKYMAEARK